MKQKDIALIIVAAFIAAVFSIGLSNFLIAPEKNRQQKAEVVEPITAQFIPPDKKFFNKDSVNPTKLITIGDDGNTTPFNGDSTSQ